MCASGNGSGHIVSTVQSQANVTIQAKLTKSEYDELLQAATEAGMEPNEYLRRAITDQAFLDRERQKGTRILLSGKLGRLRELVA
jgi:hypothetical protein